MCQIAEAAGFLLRTARPVRAVGAARRAVGAVRVIGVTRQTVSQTGSELKPVLTGLRRIQST